MPVVKFKIKAVGLKTKTYRCWMATLPGPFRNSGSNQRQQTVCRDRASFDPAAIKRLLTLAVVAALFVAGCAGPNANPPVAGAHTGYVDFHADVPDELGWEVMRFDERTQDFARLYSELDPPPGGVLRLAFAPGPYRLRARFLNRVVIEPAIVQIEVKDGMITPVRIVLNQEGTALVQSSEKQRGATGKGRFGRRVKFSSDETRMYRLSAEAGDSAPYQVRERMPYARLP